MSVANKGRCDLEAHISTAKHKKQIQSCIIAPAVGESFIEQNSKTEEWVTTTEGALSFHAVKISLII
jgi:hypothetical protein